MLRRHTICLSEFTYFYVLSRACIFSLFTRQWEWLVMKPYKLSCLNFMLVKTKMSVASSPGFPVWVRVELLQRFLTADSAIGETLLDVPASLVFGRPYSVAGVTVSVGERLFMLSRPLKRRVIGYDENRVNHVTHVPQIRPAVLVQLAPRLGSLGTRLKCL